jgi:regulator of RNase E activity RraA
MRTNMPTELQILDQLARLPAAMIESAVAEARGGARNSGVLGPGFQRVAGRGTVVGYAVTAVMGTTAETQARDSFDWYTYVQHVAGPKVLCVSAASADPSTGVLFGKMSAAILQAYGCRGVVADGYVRDAGALEELGFSCLARGCMLRHGVPHVAAFGESVSLGDTKVNPSEIVAFDTDGAIVFARELLPALPAAIARIERRTGPVLQFVHAHPNPSPAALVEAQKNARKENP